MMQAVAVSLPSIRVDPDQQQASDESLARLAVGGDRAALDRLIRRWQVPLMRFLQRHLHSRWDAEDVLQKVFLRMYEHLGSFDAARSFRTWIFTIAYHCAVSHGRSRAMRSVDPDAVDAVSAAAPRDDDPAAQAAGRDQQQRLWEIAREHLTEAQYTALWLHYVEQLPAAEVARVMGSSWVAVKTTLHRARRRLMPHVRELV